MDENRKIRVAVLESKYGGQVTCVNDLYRWMDPSCIEVRFIYLQGRRGGDNHLEKQGYAVHYLSEEDKCGACLSLMRLVRLLKKERIDLLHCHAHKSTVYGAVAGFFLPNLKIISHVHGLGRSKRFRRKLTNFIVGGRVDRFLPVARAVENDLLQSNWRISRKKVTVLENSIDYDMFAGLDGVKRRMRQRLGIPEEAFVFGSIGRLAPMKGQHYMIEAMAKVRMTSPQCRLLIVGEGPLRADLEAQIEDSGLKDYVYLVGKRKDVAECIQAMDVFVLSSVASEGMPRALLEAMAGGIPCIVTDLSGLVEVIDDPGLGVVIPSRDSAALANAMQRFVRMRDTERKAVGERGRKKVESFYRHAVVAQKLKAVYLDVLGS